MVAYFKKMRKLQGKNRGKRGQYKEYTFIHIY